jgi:cholesterol oxidase
VAVLERGRRYFDEDFADSAWDLKRFLWSPALGLKGIFRMSVFKDVFVASGSGVGGGSLVWANTMYRAKPAFFTHPQWPDTADWSQVLAPHYTTAEKMLGMERVPHDSAG